MNKKQIFMILAIVVAILAVVTATVLLWTASDVQPEQKAPVSAVEDSIFDEEASAPAEDAATPPAAELPQADESDEPLEGTTAVEPVEPDVPLPAPGELSYEDYNAMSAASQRAYMESFENVEDFFVWYYDAKDTYDAEHPDIDVGDGVIDLEDLLPKE